MNQIAGPQIKFNSSENAIHKFRIECVACGSKNVTIDIDWASYPSCSWNNGTIICRDCHVDEEIYESTI